MLIYLILGINDDVFYDLIYNYIINVLQLKIVGMYWKIRVCKFDYIDQQYLGCKQDDLIFEVEYVGFLDNGILFEYFFLCYWYDKFVVIFVNIWC